MIMKRRHLLFTGLLLAGSTLIIGQTQLENPGFENWEDAGTSRDEPVDWSTVKTSDNSTANLGAPVVWDQSSGNNAHSGSYGIKLENVFSFLGQVTVTGLLTSGRVHVAGSNGNIYTDASDPQWHMPFTGRPDSLVGWYKYSPSGSDRCKAQVILHTGAAQLPVDTDSATWIADVRFEPSSATVGSWTRFSQAFTYFSSATPEYALAILTSGFGTAAVTGSIAYFDDLELIYNVSTVEELISKKIGVFASASDIQIDVSESLTDRLTVSIYDVQGRQFTQNRVLQEGRNALAKPTDHGMYILSFSYGSETVNKKLAY